MGPQAGVPLHLLFFFVCYVLLVLGGGQGREWKEAPVLSWFWFRFRCLGLGLGRLDWEGVLRQIQTATITPFFLLPSSRCK
jgi:hypothetical protein